METETIFNGSAYLHSQYVTAAKRKNLPEEVKKAIMGKDYVEPVVVENPIVEEENPIV